MSYSEEKFDEFRQSSEAQKALRALQDDPGEAGAQGPLVTFVIAVAGLLMLLVGLLVFEAAGDAIRGR